MSGIEERLRSLGRSERAPADFAGRVLAAVGTDAYAEVKTPIGPFFVAWSQKGVTEVVRAESAERFESDYARRFGCRVEPAREVPRRIAAAFAESAGTGLHFDLRGLTEFERAVLMKTLEIPRGEVRTYAWIAREIGRPKAVRAVGTALGNNPVPLLIPCHRVVRSDGRIGEYSAGGPPAKRALLSAEGVPADELERIARAGTRFIGSDTTRVFCMPTCRDARRIRPEHRVAFRSEEQAYRAGYRPCRRCRPSGVAA